MCMCDLYHYSHIIISVIIVSNYIKECEECRRVLGGAAVLIK